MVVMNPQQAAIPDQTAVRVALWRAMHVQVDPAPHVLADELGLRLAAPDENWRQRPDMHPQGTRGFRASIVARARFVEDLVLEQAQKGLGQYIILGAGLDTFAQRKAQLAPELHVFEVDQPATQAWKRQRLEELGFGIPSHLHFVPVDFEAGESWRKKLSDVSFDVLRPAVVSSTGVSMYLTREANLATLREVTTLARGSVIAMTFMLPIDLLEAADRPLLEMVCERARAAGTPFISFFRPEEAVALAREAGFRSTEHVSRAELIRRYFAGRADGLLPSSGEEFLVATV
jgi:methyltransferase (TIGR00027 family)